MAEQPCKGRLCMDGVGVDCLGTCLSDRALARSLARPRPVKSSSSVSARYEGRCRECKGRIAEGDPIVVSAALGAVHEGCA